jgi:hypothetical protein
MSEVLHVIILNIIYNSSFPLNHVHYTMHLSSMIYETISIVTMVVMNDIVRLIIMMTHVNYNHDKISHYLACVVLSSSIFINGINTHPSPKPNIENSNSIVTKFIRAQASLPQN